MSLEKVFVIDTNIILNDCTIPFTLRNGHIYLPQIVIQELDKKRDFLENRSAAYNARNFCRKLRKMIKEQKSIELQVSGTSKIILMPTDIPKLNGIMQQLGLETSKADSMIIASAWQLQQEGHEVTLLTNDTNMWVTAATIGLTVEDYEVNRQFQDLYSGVKVITLEDTTLIDQIYSTDSAFVTEDDHPELYPNEILVFKSQFSKHSSAIVLFEGYEKPLKKIPKKEKMIQAGIRPLNKEQSFAFELLKKDEIACVTLAGRAGTGKSIVALSYAVDKLTDKRYEKIMVLKPIIPVGRDLGFLPGTLEEKLEPWMESFRDSLDIIFKGGEDFQKDGVTINNQRSYDFLVENGILEFKPLTFLRGRSIQNTLIILDEAQNTSVHEMKTLLTRVGEGSRMIAIGDVDQIDAPWLDQQNNGLTYLVERGKTTELIGHITFIKSHRSPLADWASSNL